jgi:hypothetical protein
MVGEKERPEDEEPQETENESEPEPEAEEPPKPRNELKVVIIMKADSIMIGAQSPDCDPVYKTLKGTLAAALKAVPGLVTEAKAKWDANPRYPKADLPEPAPSPTPTRTSTASQSRQPSFF